jgi:dUTP pyrophosphatase
MSESASGMDLYAANEQSIDIRPGDVTAVPTGLSIEIPPGYEGQVRMRSGLALRHGLCLPNAPGTIDADYRGHVQIIVGNIGQAVFRIERGMRIAQLVICPVVKAQVEFVAELEATSRGDGGFGHTGLT